MKRKNVTNSMVVNRLIEKGWFDPTLTDVMYVYDALRDDVGNPVNLRDGRTYPLSDGRVYQILDLYYIKIEERAFNNLMDMPVAVGNQVYKKTQRELDRLVQKNKESAKRLRRE